MSGLAYPSTKPKQREWLDAVNFQLEDQILCLEETYDEPMWGLRDVLDKLRVMRAELHNRSPLTRGRIMSQPMTPTVRQGIQNDHAMDPSMPQHEIAKRNGVNQGRVNNELRGVRT